MIRFSNALMYVHNALTDRKGVTALEYGVIAAGIVLSSGRRHAGDRS